MSQLAGQPQFFEMIANAQTIMPEGHKLMMVNLAKSGKIENGTLDPKEANLLAQDIFIKKRLPLKPNSLTKDYVIPYDPTQQIAQLKKSGYEYREVVPMPAHGEAVKISSAQTANPTNSATTDTSTSASTPKLEEGFFAKNKTAIIVVGCFALAGTAYYFYTQKKK